MQSLSNLFSSLFSGMFVVILIMGCAGNPDKDVDSVQAVEATQEKVETTVDGVNSIPVLEEVLPDSGLLEGVNPEEIITDDWNSDGPDAEATDD